MAKPQEESLDQHPETVGTVGMMKTAVNWGVAALSCAVIGSFVIWMVNLGLRDPHDVPIVRAMEGPSRVAPTDPGGKQALHQGLAVNSVQSEGGVASPSNTVVLAPEPSRLTDDDQPIKNVTPVQKLQGLASTDPAVIQRTKISGTEYSPDASLRPKGRPTELSTEITSLHATSSNLTTQVEGVNMESVPFGTRLIQLGAYDDAELAKSEWAKLRSKHSRLLVDKKRLVVSSQSNGRKFYRLRAAGFNSLDETRALCSALLAVGTPCISVTAN